MLPPLPSLATSLRRCLRLGVRAQRRWGAAVTTGRWLDVLRQPVQLGVLLEHDRWHVVLPEPATRPQQAWHAPTEPTEPTREGLQYLVCSPGAGLNLLAAGPALQEALAVHDLGAAWHTALQALRSVVPSGACHLSLSWPDEALWSAHITLTGPVSEAERVSLLEQELAQVLPVPLHQVAWDARPIGQAAQAPLPPTGWRAVLAWWRVGHPESSLHTPDDSTWQCWAMPRVLARQIGMVGQQLGWSRVSLEPRSVSGQRAATWLAERSDWAHPDTQTRWSHSPEVAAAWGAAHRRVQDTPDLLRGQRGRWWERWPRRVQAGWPWWLAWGLMAGMGYALGGVHQQRWAREHEDWAQRLRQLQISEQAHEAQRQLAQQTQQRQREQQERRAYNQRFAQVLQGWADTVPPGVQWQQLSLRPQLIDLQGQALGVESFTRWMEVWSQALPSGAQHQVEWQPQAPTSQGVPAQPLLGVRVQVSWRAAPAERP